MTVRRDPRRSMSQVTTFLTSILRMECGTAEMVSLTILVTPPPTERSFLKSLILQRPVWHPLLHVFPTVQRLQTHTVTRQRLWHGVGAFCCAVRLLKCRECYMLGAHGTFSTYSERLLTVFGLKATLYVTEFGVKVGGKPVTASTALTRWISVPIAGLAWTSGWFIGGNLWVHDSTASVRVEVLRIFMG